MKIEKLVRKNVLDLNPYSSARNEFSGQGYIQLDANENPFESAYNRYPDPFQTKLKAKIAEYKKLSPENLILGNGSDELIDLFIRAFCEPGIDNVVGLKPSYGMYEVTCRINNIAYNKVALNDDFELDPAIVLNQIDADTKIVFLCSPNNPTGNTLNQSDVQQIIENFSGIVVIDEAYIDFADQVSWSSSLSKYSNLVILQTFSKYYGLAGIRLGMAWCSKDMVDIINKIKPPYNVNELTQQTALNLLSEPPNLLDYKDFNTKERRKLSEGLIALDMVEKVYPSQANFILVKVSNANKIYSFLKSENIIVRNRTNEFGCENCLRISIGTEIQNETLLKKLKVYEKSLVY